MHLASIIMKNRLTQDYATPAIIMLNAMVGTIHLLDQAIGVQMQRVQISSNV